MTPKKKSLKGQKRRDLRALRKAEKKRLDEAFKALMTFKTEPE